MLGAIFVGASVLLLFYGAYVAAALMAVLAFLLLRRLPAEEEPPPKQAVQESAAEEVHSGVPPLHRMTARFYTARCNHPPRDADERLRIRIGYLVARSPRGVAHFNRGWMVTQWCASSARAA